MSIINLLKTVMSIGTVSLPSLLTSLAPVGVSLITAILRAVLQSEATLGAGKGDQKRDLALSIMNVAMEPIIKLIEIQTGRKLADPVQLAAGITQMQEGAVKVLNSFTILESKPPEIVTLVDPKEK